MSTTRKAQGDGHPSVELLPPSSEPLDLLVVQLSINLVDKNFLL